MTTTKVGQFPSLELERSERDVVRGRAGSVLARGLVLKTDQRVDMRDWSSEYALQLQGAPYFRAANLDVGVYGLAQPSILGLKTVLALLQCQPVSMLASAKSNAVEQRCIWVCTREEPVIYVGDRPFVLREANRPKYSLGLSNRAENLEAIEERLKQDILQEARKFNGLLLVHDEKLESLDLVPTWVAVNEEEVRTVREVWESIQKKGWRVDYHRLPIARDQPLEHNYLDAYTQVIKGTDPRRTVFVTNCGAGISRTTFAMIAAVIVRRRQLMLLANDDPFEHGDGDEHEETNAAHSSQLAHSLQRLHMNVAKNRSLLQLVCVMTDVLPLKNTQTALEQLISHPVLLESLLQANMGHYGVIRRLCGLLDEGLQCKAVVDTANDACHQAINLRESILENRIKYSANQNAQDAEGFLSRAGKSLEVYYSLIAFASYVRESRTAVFQHRFVDWLKDRAEIWRGIQRVRMLHQHLSIFEPVSDVTVESNGDAEQLGVRSHARFNEGASQAPLTTGDEFTEFVLRHRSGIVLHSGLLLKRDIWREFSVQKDSAQQDATVNFRQVPETNIFGTGQPSVQGIYKLLNMVMKSMHMVETEPCAITWVNLREEPLVYVNGQPYCLRQRELSLRNIRDYSGIIPERLGQLEDRLRQDVIHELKNSDGKLLLHTETKEGSIVPLWEDAKPCDIATVQGVMDEVAKTLPGHIDLVFRRVPVTAEKSLEVSDVMDMVNIVLSAYRVHSPIIVNCQLGRGRTTLVSVFIMLIERWIQVERPSNDRCLLLPIPGMTENGERPEKRLSYHVTNGLLRVIPRGLEVKRIVDECIDHCSSITNLRKSIEDARVAAVEAKTNEERKQHLASGLQSLRRYFHLLLFQAYLETVRFDTITTHTLERFIKRQPVLATIAKDLDEGDMNTITPLRKMDIGDGMALSDEVREVVSNRSGSVLGPYTMLKSDFFSGILKAGLPLRVEGMPNLRGVNPLVPLGTLSCAPPASELPTARKTWGCGMPTVEGLRRGLKCMGAEPGGTQQVVWTNLREEPVLYVNGRPHVLRLADQPLTNVEATGVTTDVVERIEQTLKKELLAEAHLRNGRVLLHDEVQSDGGDFEIFPLWESVRDEDVLTPQEVYQLVCSEGYRVQYSRVAITDEQAPVPQVFSQLEDRVQRAIDTRSMTVFNCQMGRGRTTSGMIIAALIVSINRYGAAWLSKESSPPLANKNDAVFDQMEDQEGIDLREDELLLHGDYRSILRLVGVLSHGKLAKTLADRVIDRMEAVQNLRKPHSKRQQQLRTVFHNYLARYGYFIVFADYLFDRLGHSAAAQGDQEDAPATETQARAVPVDVSDDLDLSSSSITHASRTFPTFACWLRERREIGAIFAQQNLD
ncbi:hypothetical protein MVES_002830 [Malassezia vespertilionis]|uniref:Paladin n=1 Tax=Malassezia vespertilionis TaxID=2020962 RepID=A0A2N1J9N6_9BASI|nr:hypothetical protein MVES_002830 [Malassezia vespertilionis]